MNKISFYIFVEFGAKLTIGRPESKKKIEATIELYISVTNPLDIYYYAQVNKMTVDDILDLFGLTTPKILKDVGFPNGYTIAFTLNEAGERNCHQHFNAKFSHIRAPAEILQFPYMFHYFCNFTFFLNVFTLEFLRSLYSLKNINDIAMSFACSSILIQIYFYLWIADEFYGLLKIFVGRLSLGC